MNNIVLQKLITAHNLIPDKGGILSNNDGYEFHKTWKSPQYLLGLITIPITLQCLHLLGLCCLKPYLAILKTSGLSIQLKWSQTNLTFLGMI